MRRRFERPQVKMALANLFYFNCLLCLVLCSTALGLKFFLEPKVIPVMTYGNGGGDRKDPPRSGCEEYVRLWEIKTGMAKRLLHEGIPLLKVRNNPQTLDQRLRGFFKLLFR
jgi:hypothetical protein